MVAHLFHHLPWRACSSSTLARRAARARSSPPRELPHASPISTSFPLPIPVQTHQFPSSPQRLIFPSSPPATATILALTPKLAHAALYLALMDVSNAGISISVVALVLLFSSRSVESFVAGKAETRRRTCSTFASALLTRQLRPQSGWGGNVPTTFLSLCKEDRAPEERDALVVPYFLPQLPTFFPPESATFEETVQLPVGRAGGETLVVEVLLEGED